MPVAGALGLPAGAARSHFQATKRRVDSATVRHQGRVIPLISRAAAKPEGRNGVAGGRAAVSLLGDKAAC